MISMIEKELCTKRKWLTKDEFLEIIAVAQSLPGILATNTSTFVGQKLLGTPGAIIATLGVTCPSFIILWSLYPLLMKSFHNDSINKLYLGVQAGVIVLILQSATNLFKTSVKSRFSKIIFVIAMLALIFLNINPIYIIIFGFIAGYMSMFWERKI